MSINYPQLSQGSVITNQVPIGGISDFARSADAYKAVGEVVSRTTYPDLSAALPRNGSWSSVLAALPSSHRYNDMAFGAGKFVAVTGTSSVASQVVSISTDGQTWEDYPLAMPVASTWS